MNAGKLLYPPEFTLLNYHFFSFGATAPLLALAYLHETFRFTSAY
jgi:hypothetical protein